MPPFGILFGAPTLRLKGDYLAIVTLGFGEIVPIVARNVERDQWRDGAERGRRPAALRLQFRHQRDALSAWRSSRCSSRQVCAQGFAHRARLDGVREVAAAAWASTASAKLLAFATRAATAGAAGYLLRRQIADRDAGDVRDAVSVLILVMIVFGGIGSVWGVVVGTLVLQMLQSWFLEDLSQWLHATAAA